MSHYNYIIWLTCFLYISYSKDYSWSWMVWACDGLEQGLASQPEIETEFWWWKHQILATRLVVSDKGPAPSALQERVPTKTESSEVSNAFIRRNRVQCLGIDTQADSEGGSLSHALVAVWITFMGCFLQISFGQTFWFAWFTVPIWSISGSSHVCAGIS